MHYHDSRDFSVANATEAALAWLLLAIVFFLFVLPLALEKGTTGLCERTERTRMAMGVDGMPVAPRCLDR